MRMKQLQLDKAESVVFDVAKKIHVKVQERLYPGNWGAFLVTSPGHNSVVLKILPDHSSFTYARVEAAVSLSQHLRLQGYPAPEYFAVDVACNRVYTLQQFVRGRIVERLNASQLRELVTLRRRHDYVGSESSGDSRHAILDALLLGGEDCFIDHSQLRLAGGRVAAILDEVIDLAKHTDARIFRTRDIVHGDYLSRNVLFDDDRISAVIDWEGAAAGDGRLDLVKLELLTSAFAGFPDSDIEHEVRSELEASDCEAVRSRFAAFVALQLLTFALRSPQIAVHDVLSLVDIKLSRAWRQ